jgi:RNA polymerase sigma-70 factor (ECF subfamily)
MSDSGPHAEIGAHRSGPAPGPGGLVPEEAALVARVRAGDPAAFAELVRGHGGRMLAVARRILGNPDDARDAVQDAFLAVWRHADGFGGECRIGTWMHRIVVNAALMKIRTRSRRREEAIDDLLPAFDGEGHMVEPAGRWVDPEQGLSAEQRRDLVRRAIAHLPDTHRAILLLRDIEDLDPGEVATLLGVSTNAVNIRLHRARQALRTLLDPHFRDDTP